MGKCHSLHSGNSNPSNEYSNIGEGTTILRNKLRSYSFVEQTNLRLRTESFNQLKLHLEFTLSNVKCKGLTSSADVYLIKVFFPSQVEKAQMASGNNPVFNIRQKVTMDVEYHKLESNFMEIVVYTLKKKLDDSQSKKTPEDLLAKSVVYSSIRFDFMTLIFGPMVYDVSMHSPLDNSINGRITFNIVSKQFNKINFLFKEFKIRITNKDLKLVNPVIKAYLKKHNESKQSTYVSLKETHSNINNGDKEYISESNAEIDHMLDFEYFYDSFPIICLYTQTTKGIVSNGNSSSNDRNANAKLKYSLIAFSAIILKNEIKQIMTDKNTQVNIFFTKLLGNISPSAIIETLPYEFSKELSKEIKAKMMWNGEKIGEFSLKLQVTNIPLISQIPCGIYTEKGLVTNSYAVYKYLPCSKQSFASYSYIRKQLHSIQTQMCNKVIKQRTEIDNKIDSIYHLALEFSEIKHLLEHSIDDNILFYQYETFDDIYDAQEAFLVIGNQILVIVDQLCIDEKLSGLDILKLVGQRGEFEQTIVAEAWFISSVSYTSTLSSKTEATYTMAPEVVKRNLIVQFFTFLLNCLKYFQSSNKTPLSKGYLLSFCANVFFKSPMFRDRITQSMLSGISLTPKDTKDIPNDQELMNSFPESKILYWDKFFNCRMKESMTSLVGQKGNDSSINEIIALANELEQLIMDEYTFSQISLRGEFFFGLIKDIFDLASLKLSKDSKEVHWLAISAIPQILVAIAHELLHKEISEFPPNLNEILTIFVHEPLIVTRLTKIIISKTNAYDCQSVYFVFNMLDTIFQAHYQHFSCCLHFDYSVLTKISKIIIQIDNSLTLFMLLWLYYKNSHQMPIWHVIEITLVIVIPHFYKLFFHWSFRVRKMFYDLLLYILTYRLNDLVPYSHIEDEIGSDSFNENRPKKKFSDLFNDYLEIIKQIQETAVKENLDPHTKTQLNPIKYKEILKYVPNESIGIIALCMREYATEEKEFQEWKNKKSMRDSVRYPIVVMNPPKEDIDI